MTAKKLNAIIDEILTRDLGFESPEPRFRDSLDFKEVSVEQAKAALIKAYMLGVKRS